MGKLRKLFQGQPGRFCSDDRHESGFGLRPVIEIVTAEY